MTFDPRDVEAATGWTVRHHPVVASTNDEAARLRDEGAPPRVAVVADRQTRGRGRGGNAFASPPGGLYASLLVAARPEDVPGALVAALALASAEAIERLVGVAVGVKWPNDLWLGERKVAGWLLEAGDPARALVAGVGVNLRAVPDELPEAVRAATACLDEVAGRAVGRGELLSALLPAVDARLEQLRAPGGRGALEAAWRRRLRLMGARVRYRVGAEARGGVLLDASLDRGLLVAEPGGAPVWRRGEHVQDVRPA